MAVPWGVITLACVTVILWKYFVQAPVEDAQSGSEINSRSASSSKRKRKNKSKNKGKATAGNEVEEKETDQKSGPSTATSDVFVVPEKKPDAEVADSTSENQKIAFSGDVESTAVESTTTDNSYLPGDKPPEVSKARPKVLKIVGTVPARQPKKPKQPPEEELTKKQRQNRKKYEMTKELKSAQSEEQERRLREYKAQKAREAMAEVQRAEAAKRTAALAARIQDNYGTTSTGAKPARPATSQKPAQQSSAINEGEWIAAGGKRAKAANPSHDIGSSTSRPAAPVFNWDD